ncbi:DNA/RNA polymerase [Desarmillaria ectypa]|nr:DNA/RNA polymerase [Desarmillaria ectypa]
MLVRTVHRAETTLLASRQGLPRPARLYSTPTRRVNAPALATMPAPQPDFPANLLREAATAQYTNELAGYLKQRTQYTFLPGVRPNDSSSPSNNEWYADSATQDLLAVMDACIHNLYDIPRAKSIFDRLRRKAAKSVLEIRVYNTLLEAYTNMSYSTYDSDYETSMYWMDTAWDLFQKIEKGEEGIEPSASTYAIMLLALKRCGPGSSKPMDQLILPKYNELLSSIIARGHPVSAVISDRVFTDSEEAATIIKELSLAAVDLNMSNVVAELGQAEVIGTTYTDIRDSIPEIVPVTRIKRSEPLVDGVDDESVEEEEQEAVVPFNLDNLRRHLAQVNYARRVLPEDVAARQKLLEESVYDVAVERLKHEATVFDNLGIGGAYQKSIRKWMWEWHVALQERLKEEIKSIQIMEKKAKNKRFLSPYLTLVQPERLSLITILELMRLQGSGGVAEGMKTTRALITLGRAVEMEYKAQMCKKNNIQIPTNFKSDKSLFTGLGYQDLMQRRIVAARQMTDAEAWTSSWTQATRSQIGGILVDCLMEVSKVTRTATDKTTGEIISEEQPAFYHSYEYIRGQKLGVLRLNPVVAEGLAKDSLRETLHPRHLPMLVPPKPWVGPEMGGYFYNRSSAMRYKDSVEQQSYMKHASEQGNVELVYAGLDVLGSTPWQINKKIFDVVLEVWNAGYGLGKLPPAVYPHPEPQPPADNNMKDRALYMYNLKLYNQEKANNHSSRCNVNYKIEIARALLGDKIYQPHNVDFRGRAYPIPPHLNHIGDDLSRGLLMFAERKPLGERGLRWLKIHLSNLYGYDKANFDEREQFVMDRIDEVFDSATKPLTGSRWWTHADDPWQCLATCMELHAALTSENPTEYLSSQPVHQDGTCNGLQHYAALGGDSRGAQQVNLSAGDRPSDVYTYVGNMVETILARDAAAGEPVADILKGKISRKIVKQTVMTTVYGVTYVGAREQIEKQLRNVESLKNEDTWTLSAYLAKVVLACIGDLFSGAKDIQNWLNLCARLIARSIPEDRLPEALEEYNNKRTNPSKVLPLEQIKKELMTSVVWTTPLGLPIVQPYRKTKRKQIMTAVQTVYISDPLSPAEVNSLKQASAFPPNFIHSLDATHMMLSALECQRQGLTFAAVHDSYWTHASSIDQMSVIIRDTFIALHQSDVLGKLREEFVERYKGYKIPLISLRGGQMGKLLRNAGASLKVTAEQAQEYSMLGSLMEITEEGSKFTHLATTAEAEEVNDRLDEMEETLGDEDEEAVDMEEFSEDGAELSDRQKKLKKRKAKNEKEVLKLVGKFVELVDLLPPVPEKGDFRVEAIKASQYFFS